MTFVWCQIPFPICPLRPGPASQKQLLTVQKATSDPFSQSLPESLLGIFYNTTASLIKPENILYLIKSNCRSSEKLWRRPLRLDKIKCKHTVKGDLFHHRHNQRFSYQACIKFSRLFLTLAYSRHQHQQRVLIQRRNISGLKKKKKKVYLNMLDQAIYQNIIDQQIDLNMFYQTTPRQMNKFHGSSTASRQGSIDKVAIIVTVTSALTFCLPGIGF